MMQIIVLITLNDLLLCPTPGASQGASPARHPPAAGKPSEPGPLRCGGLVQEFFRNVCSGRPQGGPASALGERPLPRESTIGADEPKPECLPGTGGLGALASLNGGTDPVTRIVNKRFMRQTAGEEMVSIMGGGGKEATGTAGAAGVWTEVRETAGFLAKNE